MGRHGIIDHAWAGDIHMKFWAHVVTLVIAVVLALVADGWAASTVSGDVSKVLIVNIRLKPILETRNGANQDPVIESVTIKAGKGNPANIGRHGTVNGGKPQLDKPRLAVTSKNGDVLYETQFSFSKFITVPLPAIGSPSDDLPSVVAIDAPEVSLVIPFIPEGDAVQIFNPGQRQPGHSKKIEAGLTDDRSLQNSPAMISVPPPSQTGVLNILLMASGYTTANMVNFESKAAEVRNKILDTEPFKSLSAQVNISVHPNQSDLGCYSGCFNIDRLLCCSGSSVMAAAAASGYFYDEIIVIHNTATYSGGGYRESGDYKTNSYSSYCGIYDGYWSATMALHELGHSFGDLCDEYSYGSEGYVYNNCVNCRATCSEFPSDSLACQLGCDAEPSYLRPEDSVMYSFSYTNYNRASIGSTLPPDGLQQRLDYFVTPAVSPLVTTTTATAVATTSATLNGTANANNNATTVTFEYGSSTSYGSTVTAGESPVVGNMTIPVSRGITGLAPDTIYHFRVKGVSSAGTSYGDDVTFTTSMAYPPTVTTAAATSVAAISATLNGTANANNSATTVIFEYGSSTSYGNTVISDDSPVIDMKPTPVSKVITGLTPNTQYHFQLKGISTAGTSYGGDMTFTTMNYPLRLSSPNLAYYTSILDAYNAATENSVIQLQAVTLVESLDLNRPVHITITGGYNNDFTAVTETPTILKGALTVTDGAVIVEALAIL